MLNKKVLAAAIVGAMFVGNVAAAQLTVSKQVYAQEIIIPVTGLVPAVAPALNWASGYNYSNGEVKYMRIELTGAKFLNTLAAPTSSNAGTSIGAINGLGTNVITFSVTADATPVVATDTFSLVLANNINIPAQGDVSVKVSLYDQASQAQAGGTTGLLSVGSYDSTVFLTFAKSYGLTSVANTLTADVASAAPAVLYGNFLADGTTAPATTATAGTLNNNLSVQLLDQDSVTAGTQVSLDATGASMTLATLFGAASKIEVEGEFASSTGVTLGGAASTPAAPYTATTTKLAWSGVPAGAVAPLVFNNNGTKTISAGEYKATFTPVSASPTVYTVSPLSVAVAGTIKRNGLELQAPLAQVPGGWLSRLVLTNTGSGSPKYTIKVLGEAGNTITTDASKLSGVVAPGTTVIDLSTVMTAFSGAPRGTLVVSVEAKDAVGAGSVQGLYQIVNPDKGSISNHVMVRPGTN